MVSKKKLAKLTASIGAVVFGVAATQGAVNADTIYTVKSGDTLSSISYKFNKDNSLVNKIAQQNSIKDINRIYVGQRLVIKSDGEIQVAPSQTTTQKSANNSQTSTVSGSDAAAKAWIANHESGGNYSATNGQYIGKYQLSASYLNGDYSAANQERVADQYVASRYGSWTAAQQHWIANGWY
ncbi:LysM peptidoglycan-binding domain-containing protein [Limosilactobacillus fastidiosus]|uniref:LysM peptidoglycan-binding domain-containing protein n=1 Tax=Limosilactobacillus fastidiosus TaxID=2759855 RepID=A0A7W3TZB8_9LACO|nr:LysM peptidoglycan-binding domain-containing protein [Limosilactobacillus fastidiosus]MBB1063281.1 LysM peptidoglycan-binding domain-containing protein [Limosilactobacillus fastidiosus]MBB1086079.1 LysM peptidoglycan-binding domain-containing protein [Limosilactobacillus fastidiosus]MCD7084591.1 LysM peptidoglycan-binding domain-containing protein [Limosilactobacillus fastidiosus]MCD7084993.1 LysM peptidoglycan-binding domain-containing protein [Limosilactobacillus fastidiosus]MCD7114505.1 